VKDFFFFVADFELINCELSIFVLLDGCAYDEYLILNLMA
jgi:hypothetical protein